MWADQEETISKDGCCRNENEGDRIRNQMIRQKVTVASTKDTMREVSRLRWFGCIKR